MAARKEVFAEAALPEAVPADSYGLHPALLDAALHAIGLGSFAGTGGDGPVLPFALTGVALHAAAAAAVRVRLAPAAGGIAVQLADPAGMPVASVESLAIRPADQAALTAAGGGQQWLFSVDWQPHEVAAVPGGRGPGVVVSGEDGLAVARLLRKWRWLSCRRRAGFRLRCVPRWMTCWVWCRRGWAMTGSPVPSW